MTDAIEGVFQKVKALGHTSVDDFIFVRKDGARYTGHMISVVRWIVGLQKQA